MPIAPERLPLVLSPTPCHRLSVLSERLGLELWIKRDDLTGFAFGGNKGRKLEYLMPEVISKRADTVVTCGALQSNFIRQLGAACSRLGIRCVAAVMSHPYEDEPVAGVERGESGNVLLDELLGVELRKFADDTWESLYAAAAQIAFELRSQGAAVHEIPIGGSSPLGAYAYYMAAEELRGLPEFDTILFASSSGSTQVGLAAAFKGSDTHVLGIACDPEPEITGDFAKISAGLAELIGANIAIRPEEFNLDFDFVGPGYGVASDSGMSAIRTLAQTEGVFLDPVYTGKAFAGLLSLALAGRIKGRVLFWHTGGTPALFSV